MLLQFKKTLLPFFVLVLCMPITAQAENVDEYKLKAAMLYNITKYVRWPVVDVSQYNEFTNEIGVCVLGASELTEHLLLMALRRKKVRGKFFQVYQLTTRTVPDACNVLLLTDDVNLSFEEQLKLVANRPILSVSDKENGAVMGSMINFIPRGKRIGFEVNPKEAQSVGLGLTSELLRFGVIRATVQPKNNPSFLDDQLDQESQTVEPLNTESKDVGGT